MTINEAFEVNFWKFLVDISPPNYVLILLLRKRFGDPH